MASHPKMIQAIVKKRVLANAATDLVDKTEDGLSASSILSYLADGILLVGAYPSYGTCFCFVQSR